MLFNSLEFVFVFLPVVLVGFYGLRRRPTGETPLVWLTVASVLFYAYWRPPYLILLIASILFNYHTARRLDQLVEQNSKGAAKRLLIARVSLNILLLGYFKYSVFVTAVLNDLLGTHWKVTQRTLPLGISFYTFTEIAFLVDIYRRVVRPGRLKDYFLFVTFFPHLIAGPIVHYRQLIPQFHQHKPRLVSRDLALGLTVFVAGLFKKVVLADTFATFASPAFDRALPSGTPLSLLPAWGAALAYTLQLYFDFSGYSDMAIGLARAFGIRFPINFNSPYKARSIIDFWRRWHITLSAFLRDYLYIPLGGNRAGQARRHLNLLVTMGLGGLWHGAGWTFIVWGLFHGALLVINNLWRALRKVDRATVDQGQWAGSVLVARLCTFLAVVVGWVFFRAHDLGQASGLLRSMAGIHGVVLPKVALGRLGPLVPLLARGGVRFEPLDLTYWGGVYEMAWLAAGVAIAMLLPNTQEIFSLTDEISRPKRWQWSEKPVWAIGAGIALTVAVVILLTNQASEFLYFNF